MDELNKQKKKMFPPKNIYTSFPSIIPHLESYLKESETQKFMFMIRVKTLKESKWIAIGLAEI